MKLVAGIDGSPHSLAALKFVSRLLDPQGDTVVLYYAVPTAALESLRPQSADVFSRARGAFAQAVFQEATAALPPELRERCVTVHDNQKPQKGLLAAATAHNADLLVVGARGTGRIQRLLLGSVSRSVAHACQLPTLIVRNAPETAAEHPLRLLVACAGVDSGRAILQLLQKLTWPAASQAHVIHVVESLFAGEIPEWLVQEARSSEVELQAHAWVLEHEQDKQRAVEKMREYCQALPPGLTQSDFVVVEGHPAEQILHALEKEPFDLTILGTHGHGPLTRVLLGSTSEHVLAHAPGSVLLVPHDGR